MRRLSLQLDGVDANAFDLDSAAIDNDASLMLARISATPTRLAELFGVSLLKEGDWLEIQLRKVRSTPRAWLLPVTNGYTPLASVNAVAMTPLGEASEIHARLEAACIAPNSRKVDGTAHIEQLLSTLGQELRVTALDVGHAACVVFSNGSQPQGYFDVGATMYFNQRSFPRLLNHGLATDGFVILSHWDFDHFALAIRYPQLKNLIWSPPISKLARMQSDSKSRWVRD